jgi:FkbM family methyltransferase
MLNGPGAFIDVGANSGIYSALALRQRRWVVAFEPVPAEAIRLRRLIRNHGVVHQVALSDYCGTAALHVPYVASGAVTTRSSLVADIDGDLPHRDVAVKVATLDSFNLPDVAFMKIDVEGHELSVLKGGVETISRTRPNLLVEVEESRVPGCFMGVSDLLMSLGYCGFWFDGERLNSVADFRPELQQANRPRFGARRPPEYINNFIWLPAEREVHR